MEIAEIEISFNYSLSHRIERKIVNALKTIKGIFKAESPYYIEFEKNIALNQLIKNKQLSNPEQFRKYNEALSILEKY